MTDYKVKSCQIRNEYGDFIISKMEILIANKTGNGAGYMHFESENNSSWTCCHRDKSLSNFKLDHIFTNHKLNELWNESVNKVIKRYGSIEDQNIVSEEVGRWKNTMPFKESFENLTMEERCNRFNESAFRLCRKVSLEEFIKLWNEN